MNIDLERLKIHWRREYSTTITYKEGEIVFYKGSCFAAKAENIGVEPIEGRDWELVAPTSIPLREKGDLLFHNGNEVIRLPIGEEEQGLQLITGVPSWSSDKVSGFPPGEEINSNLPNLVYKLAKMGLSASDAYRTYLMADGSIKAVGDGGSYRNGDPNGSDIYIPSRVNAENNETRFKELFSGDTSNYAIDTDDNVWSWGNNSDGQLGHGNTTNLHTAKKIEYFSDNNISIKNVVCGNKTYDNTKYCALFLSTDGKVYGCGNNENGQLGDGTTTQSTTPVRCGTLENIAYIYASPAYHAVYAIDSSGALWVWGANEQGQLGVGNTSNQTSPQLITVFTSVKKVIGGNGNYEALSKGYAIAIQNDGTLWGTGYNGDGNLGLGDTTNKNSWTRATTSVKFKDIACSAGFAPSAAGISIDDRLYVWGANNNGQLGDGTTTSKNVPTLSIYSAANNVTKILFGGESYLSIFVGDQYRNSLYFQTGNTIYAAGYGSRGNLGAGNSVSEDINSSFAPVVGVSTIIKDWTIYGTADSYGLSVFYTDGQIDAAGFTTSGQTGTQRTTTGTVSTLRKVIF